MAITIRPVARSDLNQVRAALLETWHATYDDIYGRTKVIEITSRWHDKMTLASQIDDADSAFLLAIEDEKILGSSLARRLAAVTASGAAEPIAHLYRLYVRPFAQGCGVGYQLMKETFAAFTDVAIQRLEVEPANKAAIAFYERAGFHMVARTSDCGGDSGMPALLYQRSVR